MIRRATLKDLDQLTNMFDQYLVFYKKPSNIKKHKAYLQERLENEEAIVYMAFDDKDNEKAIGFALLYITFSSLLVNKIVILNDIYVDLTTRKNGVGAALINETISYAKEVGINLIRLRTAKNNVIAQKMYHKMGFVKDEHLYGYDLIIK